MFEMNSEDCIAYSIENGREICLIKKGVPPKDCEKCEKNKKQQKIDDFNVLLKSAEKEVFTVLEYKSLKKVGGITFWVTKNTCEIRLSAKCFDALGKPEYIVFALSGDKKKLKISAADGSAANAVKAAKNSNGGARIFSVYLARQIEPYGNYGVGKQSESNLKEIIFDLKIKERETE